MINIQVDGINKDVEKIKPGKQFLLRYPCKDNINNHECYPYEVNFQKGKYLLELWSASGSDLDDEFGRGAYTSGIITFSHEITLYFYLGNIGKLNSSKTYNGGGSGSSYGYSGGGSTDVRITKSSSNDPLEFGSLLSRIMVAGGGAGYSTWGYHQNSCVEESLIRGGFGNGGEGPGSNGDHKKMH